MSTTARDRLNAKMATASTTRLLAYLLEIERTLDGMTAEHTRYAAWITMRVAASDAVTTRHPAVDAQINEWMEDETDAGLAFLERHSYTDLVLLACDMNGIR